MGTTTDDDDATDDGRSAVVGRSTTAGAKQKMSKLMIKFSYGTSGATDVTIHTLQQLYYTVQLQILCYKISKFSSHKRTCK